LLGSRILASDGVPQDSGGGSLQFNESQVSSATDASYATHGVATFDSPSGTVSQNVTVLSTATFSNSIGADDFSTVATALGLLSVVGTEFGHDASALQGIEVGGIPCSTIFWQSSREAFVRAPAGTGVEHEVVVLTVGGLRSTSGISVQYEQPAVLEIDPIEWAIVNSSWAGLSDAADQVSILQENNNLIFAPFENASIGLSDPQMPHVRTRVNCSGLGPRRATDGISVVPSEPTTIKSIFLPTYAVGSGAIRLQIGDSGDFYHLRSSC